MPTKYVDYLTEDDPMPGQNWVCLSFLAPEIERIKNCSLRGIKVRGVFNKREDADEHAEKLRKKDPDFDIFVGEVGKWLPWDPDPEQIENEKWQEKELNHIASKYKKAREQSKVMFEERKEEMMRKTALEEDNKLKKIRSRLRKKLDKQKQKELESGVALDKAIKQKKNSKNSKDKNEPDEAPKLLNQNKIDEMMKRIKDKEEELKKERDSLVQKSLEVHKEQEELNQLDNELKEVEALYQAMEN